MKKFALRLTLLLALFSLLLAILNIQIVKAQPPYEPVTIRADGTIDPATAPIQRVGDVYTLTGDMDNIRVERNDMMLDGNGHTLTGKGRTMAVYVGSRYVTIKNLIINGGNMGISLASSSSNVTISGNVITGVTVPVPELQATGGICVWEGDSHVISGNHIENNYIGVYLYESSNNNISGNNITNNKYGLIFWEASNNIIYHNRLTNNTVQVYDVGVYSPDRASPSVNKWDNGTTGNYWSDYNGTDINRDGIGDTPYVIYENNQDNYPLMDEGGKFEPYLSTSHILFEDKSHKLLGNLSAELRITEPETEIIRSVCNLSLSSPRLDEYHEPYIDKVELVIAWFFDIHPWGAAEIPIYPPYPEKVTLHVDEEIILFERSRNVSDFVEEPRVVTWFMETKIEHHKWWPPQFVPTIRVYFSDGQEWEWTYEDNGTLNFTLWPEMDVNLSELSGKIETETITFTTVKKGHSVIITSVRLIVLASIIIATAFAAVFVKYRNRARAKAN